MRTAAFLPRPLPLSHPAAVDFAAGEPSNVCSSKRTIIHIMAKAFPLRVCLFIVVFGVHLPWSAFTYLFLIAHFSFHQVALITRNGNGVPSGVLTDSCS